MGGNIKKEKSFENVYFFVLHQIPVHTKTMNILELLEMHFFLKTHLMRRSQVKII